MSEGNCLPPEQIRTKQISLPQGGVQYAKLESVVMQRLEYIIKMMIGE